MAISTRSMEHSKSYEGTETDHRRDAEVETWQTEARDWQLQYLISHSFVQSLSRSLVWRMLRPFRAMRQLLRSRGFSANDLVPWHDLEPDREAAAGTWIATGPSPYFVVPCVLPTGWLRVHIRMTTEVPGRLELSDIGGNGVGDFASLKQIDVRGRVERDDFIYLCRTALGLRVNPLNTTGRFRMEDLRVTPVSPLGAAVHALRNKLAALRRYGLVRPALVNGLGLLLRGRLAEFSSKLYDGLRWSKNAHPDGNSRPPKQSRLAVAPEDDVYRVSLYPVQKLNIVYVLKDAGLCGGIRVVLEHATRLRARGHNVSIYYLGGGVDFFRRPVPAIRFDCLDALKAALGRFRGIKVATWYQTAPWVVDSLRPGDRGYYLVQDVEEGYALNAEEGAAVRATYRLDLRPITEGVWVRDQLRQRFGRDSVFIGIGLDFDVFRPVSGGREPQRILTQARTWSAGGAAGARLKGWETARNTVLRCFELNPSTTLTTFSVEGRPQLGALLPHSHFQLPSDPLLAKLYSHAGLYLLTSTHEGFGLTAAEAMACGCPVVATFAQGNEEFCIDGRTALMAPAGDVEQLAKHCRILQCDPSLAAELGERGRRFILDYTWDRVVDRLERDFLREEEGLCCSPQRDSPQSSPDAGTQPKRHQRASHGRPKQTQSSDGEYPDLRLSKMHSLDCTVVIPTINDAHQVVQCISSCRQFLPAGADVEFIVVDDGTRDASLLNELQQASSELKFQLLYNYQNLGFSATVNHGMRHARGRYIVLSNNDIVFFQPWMGAVEKAFESDPELGILGARLLYPNGSIQHAGVDKVVGQLRWHHAYGGWPGDHPRVMQSRHVWSVTGALFVVRRDVLQQLGGFSTAFATAYEDLDYCLHAWSSGIRVGYCAELAAYHREGGTRGATADQKRNHPLLWTERERAGGLYFEKKWAALRQVENFELLLRRLTQSWHNTHCLSSR
jgi:GT2 family glycosyltransferase/glycosyltransferase involved in cell wall biosynthesis